MFICSPVVIRPKASIGGGLRKGIIGQGVDDIGGQDITLGTGNKDIGPGCGEKSVQVLLINRSGLAGSISIRLQLSRAKAGLQTSGIEVLDAVVLDGQAAQSMPLSSMRFPYPLENGHSTVTTEAQLLHVGIGILL
ncbi:hypothetical protein E4U27_004072 [Claviceps purpurea]|nr:hypothetical protein E4U51_000054 [Claviceps purpurea]KAG6177881.1 hypothetical protein E4U27_004072 [Claviceps purpurea]KAG6273500.1 hypothetical protein E4U49_000120 [Claviceps purpurea]KAG6308817.1 hypothetical protein E4U45_005917 [Claviceps purpurea]